jgi:hypothetical protein
MLPRIVTIQLLTMCFFLSLAVAADKVQMVAMKSPVGAKLSTDIHFDGVNVSGRRQSPFGASAVVENEKATPNLIDYRTNYADRIQRSKSGR